MKVRNMDLSNIGNRAIPKEGDYYDDGLLYCGKCKTKRETKFAFALQAGGENISEVIFPCLCKCESEALEMAEHKRKHEDDMRRIQSLKSNSLIESRFKDVKLSSFIKTNESQKLYFIIKKYVDDFNEMYKKNQGLIFWGPVGTGKSYAAACIANELLEKMNTVIMTSFVKILQDIQKVQMNEAEYMTKLNDVKLLIIDDLGTERNTDYALEKVYNIVDSRYRSGKPLILTTNMSISEMMGTEDIRYKRIYDRIFEMCYPVKVDGKSWRKYEAAKRFAEMTKFMEDK